MKKSQRERRQFTREFKAQIVRLVVEEKRPIAQVAREHEVLRKSVHDWVAQARVDAGEGPSEKLTTSEREERVRLRKALKQAEMGARYIKKSDGVLREADDVKFAFVAAESAFFPTRLLCKVVGVSPSGFYDWRARSPSARDADDARLLVRIRAFFEASRGRYGAWKIHRDLLDAGIRTSRKRVARLMHEAGLCSRRARKLKVTTDSKHALPIADNVLERRFDPPAPNQAWVSDITYVWTSEGWLYLAVILDLFSRRVVGFATSSRIDTSLVLDALRMAVGRREISAGLVLHSDRGSQYASNGLTPLFRTPDASSKTMQDGESDEEITTRAAAVHAGVQSADRAPGGRREASHRAGRA